MATSKKTPAQPPAPVADTPVPDTAAPAAFAPDAPSPPATPAQQRPYRVGAVPIRHDGVLYPVGAAIALTAAQASRLGGLVTPQTHPVKD